MGQLRTTSSQRGGDAPLREIVNLPTTPDGTGRTGSGYIWRVSSIEEHEDPLIDAVLVLDFEQPHPDQE